MTKIHLFLILDDVKRVKKIAKERLKYLKQVLDFLPKKFFLAQKWAHRGQAHGAVDSGSIGSKIDF